jgi:ABC-type antimicrobial peptide transport system permease subunit
VGLYGVKAYSVARRTREIGIRMALGAQAGAVLRMIMREGSIMLVSGVAIGLLLAVATAKIVSGILYGVGALDPVAFTVAPVVLTVAALVAMWLPARRATRVDPVQALHAE